MGLLVHKMGFVATELAGTVPVVGEIVVLCDVVEIIVVAFGDGGHPPQVCKQL